MLFSTAQAAINSAALDLSTGTYYAHLVRAIPSDSITSVGQLDLCQGDNYVPAILTGLVYTPGIKWTFDDFRFPVTIFSTPVMAIVICKQLSASMDANDLPIAYSQLADTNDQVYSLPAATFSIDVDFPSNGAIEF